MENATLRRDTYALPDGTYRCLGTGASIKGKMFLAHIAFAMERDTALQHSLQPLWDRIADEQARARLSGKIMEGDWIDFAYLVALDEAIHAQLGGDPTRLFRAMASHSVKRNMKPFQTTRLHEAFRTMVKLHDGFQNFGKALWAPDPSGAGVRADEVRGGKMSYVSPAFDRSFCEGTIGFFQAYVQLYGVKPTVTEESCHCRGDTSCVFHITW